ncbi:hypothetical protein WG904_03370 [Pedobacter sp. Du54]|uniref:hypothetical protein n=1 Tax=Pedobacter anseongensis TaxID=3133439 RepID=UPI0030A73D9F
MQDFRIPSSEDTAHAALRGTLAATFGSLPFFGPYTMEVFDMLVTSPLAKRRDQIILDIQADLIRLNDKGTIDLSQLSKNEKFLDTILLAINFATRTSQKEKIAAFKNCIINAAIGIGPNESISHLVLNLINELTVWHLIILKFIDTRSLAAHKDFLVRYDQGAGVSKEFEKGGKELLFSSHPELAEDPKLFDYIRRDLMIRKLVITDMMDFKGAGVGFGVDFLGRELMDFITLNDPLPESEW